MNTATRLPTMLVTPSRQRRELLFALCLGALATFGWYQLTAHLGYDLSDEGFFWYGAQRTLQGELPLMDFSAYDIGRYYYTALVFLALHDDGIMAARIAGYSAIFLVVSAAVHLVCRSRPVGTRMPEARALLAALLALGWTTPYYKAFDFLACALLLVAVCRVLARPDARRWAWLGVATGVAALLGRNHGTYGLTAGVLAFALLHVQRRQTGRRALRAIPPWALGIALGYTPMLAALAMKEGFAAQLVDGIQRQVASGSTNLALAVPWPWTVDVGELGGLTSLVALAIGFGFLLLLAFPVGGLAWLLRHRRAFGAEQAPFAACVCVAVPYAHYAFSRADTVHLALSMLPVAIGLLALPVRNLRLQLPITAALFVGSIAVLVDILPGAYLLNPHSAWDKVQINGTELVTYKGTATKHRLQAQALHDHLPPQGSFLAQPNMPGLHAEHRMAMPVYTIYTLRPTGEKQESREIRRLEGQRPAVILVSNHALDGNEQQRFSKLRPRIYQWIQNNYRRVDPTRTNAASREPASELETYVLR